MEIIKNFGIEPKLLIAQIINFVVVLYVLRRLLYKPLMGLIKTREDTIKEGLRKAEEAQKLMEKTKEEEKKILQQAQTQARTFIEHAKEQSSQLLKDAQESAKKQTDVMVKEAREQIVLETREAQRRLSGYVSNLAVEFLERSIQELFSEKDQDLLVKQALRKMKKRAD